MSDTKVCTKCSRELPIDQFGRDRQSSDGRAARCRECLRIDSREANRRFRTANPDAVRAIKGRYRAANIDKERAAGREYRRRRYAADPEAARERAAREKASRRDTVLDHYGRACACCGSPENLTIDHVNGDGKAHRAEIGKQGGVPTYRWLIANGFPEGFQTLCMPCNSSKRNGERCRLDHTAAEVA